MHRSILVTCIEVGGFDIPKQADCLMGSEGEGERVEDPFSQLAIALAGLPGETDEPVCRGAAEKPCNLGAASHRSE
jgi:hypothetical protein